MTTVCINTLNEHPDYLCQAIESYLRQTSPVHIILSTVERDRSVPFVRENFPSVQVLEFPVRDHPISHGIKSPVGSYLQINYALEHLRGDWFCFASSNDTAHPDKIRMEIASCLDNNKEICYSAFNEVTEDGEYLRTLKFGKYSYDRHLQGNFVSDCALVSRRVIDKYAPFRVTMKNYAYWDFWLRVYKGEGDIFCYNPLPTWNYRQSSESMHIKRMKSPDEVAKNNQDREFMLSFHR